MVSCYVPLLFIGVGYVTRLEFFADVDNAAFSGADVGKAVSITGNRVLVDGKVGAVAWAITI